ncbi:MAG TPA: phosphomannomutase/phosphoglucomutase [Clostridia bacterium]|nr:phosphomannomutase/phosphoglucomutase [Clostridia bacterium]
MNIDPSIFKDYDVRGIYPKELNYDTFYQIARELALFYQPKIISIGRDIRESSKDLQKAMINGFIDQGVDVVDLRLITTDMIYFASGKYNYDLSVGITGSHVEKGNGFKICKKGALTISGEEGLYSVRDSLLKRKSFPEGSKKGKVSSKDILNEWIAHALSFINPSKIKPLKIVVDTGNGMGGLVMQPIEEKLPGEFINLFPELDGTFPNHFPNPLIFENQRFAIDKIKKIKADLGIVFDADGDRAFFIDENGKSLSGTILTATVAQNILKKNPGETILYNAVCGRIVPEVIKKNGGKAIRVRVGHSIIRGKMREENAIFAGEHSGHFYFRDNYYADSGLIMVLEVLELVSQDSRPLSEIVKEFDKYPQSGEINFKVEDKKEMMKLLEDKYKKRADSTDWLDGVSVWFSDWWFNVRPSNTEPLLRLNVEADNQELLEEKISEVIKVLTTAGAVKK